ncbi:hypothetical protein BDV93DRAFT_545224 [Ceratobasidium sp. AG-I]|nr:hypothetical protein BDV93DRAFT_545224 [Ceratobasidium sp. AG-I]
MSYHHGHGPYNPHHAPGPTYFHYNRMRRGPSRFIWFGLGGLATYWFINSRERRHQMISQGEEKPAERSCMSTWSGGWGSWGDHHTQARQMQMQQQMEEQQRRMRGFGQSASETIVDMTESSLDSVMASVVALKAKLADQRAANQAARKAMEDEPRQV